jgi:ABC-type glycerol-3-phosphate transport system substrate-binding protein
MMVAMRSTTSALARRALVAAVIALGLVACSGGSDGAAPTSSNAAPASGVPASLRFTAPIVGGGELDGATLANRAVMLWFWAPT